MDERQIVEVMELCKKNIMQYIKDAELLLRNDSFGHAKGFIILAFEEVAKIFLWSLRKLNFSSYKMGAVEDKINIRQSIFQHKSKLEITKDLLKGLLYAEKNEDLWNAYLVLKDEISVGKRIQSLYVDFDEGAKFISSPFSAERNIVRGLFEMLKFATVNLDFLIYSDPQKDKALRYIYKLLEGNTIQK